MFDSLRSRKKESKNTSCLPQMLDQLLKQSETGEFGLLVSDEALEQEDERIISILNKVIQNYKSATEYDFMKYKLSSEALGIALWDMDVVSSDPVNPQNKFTWSQEFRHMLGFENEKDFPNVLHSWSDRLHPADKERTLNAFEAHMSDHSGSTPYDIEYRLMLKNGEYRFFHAFGTTFRDCEGIPLRVAGALMDIEEKKKMMSRMNEANERLMLMLDTSPLCAQIWDRNLNTIDCNEAAVRLYGFKDKQEYIDRFIDCCSPKIQPDGQHSGEKAAALVELAFTEGHCVFDWMHKMPDDSMLIPAEVTLVKAKHGDDDVVIGYTRDLREHKAYLAEIEETQENLRLARDTAETANKTKSVFLANMSHEIRTPMNSIIGFSELALYDDIPIKTREYLLNIKESAEWLLQIINDILDISKIESGKTELELIPFDLAAIFAHCQSEITPTAKEKGITLYCYSEQTIGKKLLGDPVKLHQALTNLVSNAVKFTHFGTVKFMSSILNTTDDSISMKFEVKDSGIGMNQEQIARVFAPFMQADNSVTRKFGGTGLGLSITKNLVELMGGTLRVDSIEGIGSVFSFELSFDTVDDDQATRPEEAVLGELKKPNFNGEVLICEDNSMNQQVICNHLERVGLRTVVAQDGKEGVDIVSRRMENSDKPFDLILMDIHMPVMDGLEASSRITELGVKTPIVALTANIMSNDLEHYKSSGMSDHVGKPFTSQELWKCLIKYLTVESFEEIDKTRLSSDDENMQRQLKLNFVKENQNTFSNLIKALDCNDIKSAHRLAHSLKSSAGQIGEKKLQVVAAVVEAMLSDGNNLLCEKQLCSLEAELKYVLADLEPLLLEAMAKSEEKTADAGKSREIIGRLEPMLISHSTECMNLLDDIKALHGAEELLRQVENFEFEQALVELKEFIRKNGL